MEYFKFTKPIRTIELFGGIGSQSKALENLGVNFEHHALVEFDKYAVQSYNAVHGTNFVPMDITKTIAEDLHITDYLNYDYVMTYSFPCQDLSRIGKKAGMEEGSGTRSSLLWEVQRLMDALDSMKTRPDVLLMENVTQVHNKANKSSFDKWCKYLESICYTNVYVDLNADFCIPQNRKRCFMISTLGDWKFRGLETLQITKKVMQDYLEENVDKKYYLSDKMKAYILDLNEVQKGTKWEGRANNDVLNPHIAHTISVRGAGGNQRAGVSNFVLDGFGEITVKELKEKYTKEELLKLPIRKLTPRECWRLMGFTDEDFDKVRPIMSDAQLYKQAGNSIVVGVLEAIFRQMF